MVDTIRIGVIGAGGNTRSRHIPGLKEQPGVELVAVANRSRASGQRVADEFGIARVADNWMSIIEDDGIDAVCIGTWPYMHAPMTIAALEAGKHVLVEARMALNSSEAQAMLDASRANPECVAQIVPAPMTLPFDRTIIDVIASGGIGELITVDARVALGSNYPDRDGPVHWRHDRVLSGNNIMSMGIFYESMMRWMGPAATVSAVGQSVVRHRLDGSGRRTAMTIPDHVDITGRLEMGGQMRLCVSSVVGHAPPVDIYLFGTEGTLRLAQATGGQMELSAASRGDGALAPVQIDPAKRGGWRVEEEFINAVCGTEEVTYTDFATGVKYMEWTDAVTLSLRGGGTVSLPLLS